MPLLLLCAALSASDVARMPAKVLECHDGDSCRVELREESLLGPALVWRETIRLCDVNTPELVGATKAEAARSRDALIGWVRSAKLVEVELPLNGSGKARREKYGRLLAWLLLDGLRANERLVSEGLADRFIACRP